MAGNEGLLSKKIAISRGMKRERWLYMVREVAPDIPFSFLTLPLLLDGVNHIYQSS